MHVYSIILLINEPLIPPGILPLTEYTVELNNENNNTDANSKIPIETIWSFLEASGWNLMNDNNGMIRNAIINSKVARPTTTITTDTKFTMFLPIDTSISLDKKDIQRLQNPLWNRHLEDYLFSTIINNEYNIESLKSLISPGTQEPYELRMINGLNRFLTQSNDEVLALDTKPFWSTGPYHEDFQGVDGYV